MKTFKTLALAALALGCSLFVSCSKNDPITVKIDFYLAGNEKGAAPVIYQNSKPLYYLEKDSKIAGIAHVDDNIYTVGSNPEGEPAIWLNGEAQPAPALNLSISGFCAAKAKDWDYFSCGYILEGGSNYGVILKNGQPFFKCGVTGTFKCIDFGFGGDVYVVNESTEGVYLYRIDFQSAQVKEMRQVAQNNDGTFAATGLYVGVHDIAVSLTKSSLVTEGNPLVETPWCWVSGELFPLSTNRGVACDVTLYNGRFFVGGSLMNNNAYFAVQWCNGYAEDFSYGCTGESRVSFLASDSYFIYEAVSYEGGIQLCCNGQQKDEIVVSSDFEPACWTVVSKVIK